MRPRPMHGIILCYQPLELHEQRNICQHQPRSDTNSLERVPAGLKSLLFRHLLFKLGRAGQVPGQGSNVGLGLGLAAGGDRCAEGPIKKRSIKKSFKKRFLSFVELLTYMY